MCFFRRKKVADKVKEDSQLIDFNSKSIDSLIVLAKDNTAVIGELKLLQSSLKYLIAMEDSKVVDYDKKIKDKLGDLRIALTKSDGEETKKTDELITEIKLAIADRRARMKG